MYKLHISFSLNDFFTHKIGTKQLEKISGSKCHNSGAGFGERDVELSFNTKERTIAGIKTLKSYFKNINVKIKMKMKQ